MIKALILDLDNTIFLTKSIDKGVINPFFEALKSANDVLRESDLEKCKQALWETPFFEVAKQYNFSKSMIAAGLNALNEIPEGLKIKPYQDYDYLKTLKRIKYLVTTGVTCVQWNKIKSLKIEKDFQEILIDDPFVVMGGKRKLFEGIMEKYGHNPGELLVIGDNPASEISAGKTLGIKTVLIDRSSRYEPGMADYQFKSLYEVQSILN
ncbi:HAD family hydrolase [Fulvivirgaceae bacterium BMA12]|uniref:HAD family hydrolase n=1 Tax=Agaribacillus aureus TaxID=3051825 RepID=A0ABT8L6X9_9BACT|nr:HAD family hydrolase [Fulvivirgaceae bacterium BMA12]